jgi:hypothetical protein
VGGFPLTLSSLGDFMDLHSLEMKKARYRQEIKDSVRACGVILAFGTLASLLCTVVYYLFW